MCPFSDAYDWPIVCQRKCITEPVEVEVGQLSALLLELEHILRQAQRIRVSKCRLNCVVNHYQRPSQQVCGVDIRHIREVGWKVSCREGQWNNADSRPDRCFKLQPDAGEQGYPPAGGTGFSDATIKGTRRLQMPPSNANLDQPPDYVFQGEPWSVAPDSHASGRLHPAFTRMLFELSTQSVDESLVQLFVCEPGSVHRRVIPVSGWPVALPVPPELLPVRLHTYLLARAIVSYHHVLDCTFKEVGEPLDFMVTHCARLGESGTWSYGAWWTYADSKSMRADGITVTRLQKRISHPVSQRPYLLAAARPRARARTRGSRRSYRAASPASGSRYPDTRPGERARRCGGRCRSGGRDRCRAGPVAGPGSA